MRNYPDPQADELKVQEQKESLTAALPSPPAMLGIAISLAILAAFYGWTSHQERNFAEQAASKDALTMLSTCSKLAAKNDLSKGKVLTNADLEIIKEQCKLPANTAQDQAEALSF